MDAILRSGRYFFIIAILGFGIEHFSFHNSLSALIPLPPELPGRMIWVYIIGALFIISALCFAVQYKTLAVSLTLATLLSCIYLLLHLPSEIRHPKDPTAWTGAFEILAICGGALLMALPVPGRPGELASVYCDRLKKIAEFLLASTMVVIGIQHFLYADFISTIIPSWMPFRLFLAYFVGIAFFAVAVSLLTGLQTRLAMICLGIMFLIFVVTIHLPRVQSSSNTEAEWSSLFVALAMVGISFTMAANLPKKANR